MKTKSQSILYLSISVIPFLYAVYCYLPLDIWNDEMYTLKYFTFTHWMTTLTDYHVPNNHIFYNILNKLTLSLLGINTLESAIQYSIVLRILPLFIGIITIILVYKIADQYINRTAAWLSIAILMGSLPWLNHFMQIRGYGLSTLLFTLNIYLCLRAMDKNKPGILLLIMCSTGLLLYTIPLNMYYILSMILFFGTLTVVQVIYSKDSYRLIDVWSSVITHGTFRIALASVFGVLLGLALYGPVISIIFNNDIVNTRVIPPAEFFPNLDLITTAFLNKRYFIIPLSLVGAILIFYKYKSLGNKHGIFVVFFMLVYILPFAIAAFRGDPAPDRSFVMLAPVFALLIGSTASIGFQVWNNTFIAYFLPIFFIYNTGISMREIHLMHNMLKQDIVHNTGTQNISRAYYLGYFESHSGVRIFSQIFKNAPAPLVIYKADYHGIRGYLDAYQIPWLDELVLDSIYQSGKDFYLLHTGPMHIQKKLSKTYPNLKCIQLFPKYDFHNYCFCKQIPIDVTDRKY